MNLNITTALIALLQVAAQQAPPRKQQQKQQQKQRLLQQRHKMQQSRQQIRAVKKRTRTAQFRQTVEELRKQHTHTGQMKAGLPGLPGLLGHNKHKAFGNEANNPHSKKILKSKFDWKRCVDRIYGQDGGGGHGGHGGTTNRSRLHLRKNGDKADFIYWLQTFEMIEYYSEHFFLRANKNNHHHDIWHGTNEYHNHFQTNSVLYLKFEDLIDEQKKFNEILKILHFLYLDFDGAGDGPSIRIPLQDQNDDNTRVLSMPEIQCQIENAFVYANAQTGIRRNAGGSAEPQPPPSQQPQQTEHNIYQKNASSTSVSSSTWNSNENNGYMTMEDAFGRMTQTQICGIWNKIKVYARVFGYEQIRKNEFDCDQIELEEEVIQKQKNNMYITAD